MKKHDIYDSNHYVFHSFSGGKAFICPTTFNKYALKNLRKYCINKDGELLFSVPANYNDNFGLNDKVFIFCCEIENKNLFSLFDEKGQNLTGFIYDQIYPTLDEYHFKVLKNGKYGFVDLSGKEVIPCVYDKANSFINGFVSVNKDGKWGCIDKNNKIIIPFDYDCISQHSQNNVLCVQKGIKWGLRDIFNGVFCDFKFDEIYSNSNAFDIFYAFSKLKYGLVDKFGNVILNFKYDKVSFTGSTRFTVLSKNGKYAFFDNSDKKFITDFEFDVPPFRDIYYYQTVDSGISDNPVFPVRKNGKWAFMDCNGNLLSDYIYDDEPYEPQGFFENLCVVKKDDKYGAVDLCGNLAIPLMYDSLGNSSCSLLCAKKGEKTGCINQKNETLIPFGKYSVINSFCDGIASVVDEKCGNQYIKINGEVIDIKIPQNI